jgi:hypothetical protein
MTDIRDHTTGGLDVRLVKRAAEEVVIVQSAEPGHLQRRLGLGFHITEQLLEAMERLGVVGEHRDGQGREVLIRHLGDLDAVFIAPAPVGGGARVIAFPSPAPAPDYDDGPETLHAPVGVDFTKPTPPEEPGDADSPDEEETPREGRVFLAGEDLPLPEDPEGDAPWFSPALRTRQGLAARGRYHLRRARRRARRWVGRQWTRHGVLPRAARGHRQMWSWVRGVEGMQAAADLTLAQAEAREADRAARSAKWALLDRSRKRELARAQQQQAAAAIHLAVQRRRQARRAQTIRGTVTYGPLAAGDITAYLTAGGMGLAGALMVTTAGLAWLGRKTGLDPEQIDAMEQDDAAAKMPDRVELGMTPRAFEAMLRQALTEDLKIALAGLDLRAPAWGFEVHLKLDRQTPKTLSENIDHLEACLPGVRTSSILLQQSASARNECVLRIPGSDPWQAVPELPYRAPKSLTTNDLHTAQIGAEMSGRPLALPAKRTNVAITGKPRSGKSTMLRAGVDALTATDDRIILGIDLGSYGAGFGPYRKAMKAVARTPKQARRVLEWALDIGMGRPALFDDLGMGLNWESSPTRPGITVVIDEFPALVKAAKQEAAERARIAKEMEIEDTSLRLDELVEQIHITSPKSDVTLMVGTHSVTKARVGENTWLSEVPAQVMCACDTDDIKLIVGGGAMAQGWRPDRLLPAMGDAINDAGVAYVMAGGAYSEPIPWRACILDDTEADRRATERAMAGLPQLDAESAAFVDGDDLSDLADWDDADADEAGGLIATIRSIFADAGDPPGMSKEDLAEELGRVDPARWDLSRFDGDEDAEDGDERIAARVDALRAAIAAVLAPTGQSWQLDNYSKKAPRGYCLRHLKQLTGEVSKAS